MTNTDVDIESREDRADALSRFAAVQPAPGNVPALVPTGGWGGGQNVRAIGAQAVAVRRDEAVVLKKLVALAAAAGTDWYYRYPVKNKGAVDWIEGPSIKLANDLARIYGNCEIDIRVEDHGSVFMFYARFTDFETGFVMVRPFQQDKRASKMGGSDEARRLDIAMQIGTSKAIRNVTVNALQTFADFAFEAAKDAQIEKFAKDVPKWQEKTAQRIAEWNIDIVRIELVIGRPYKEWRAPDISRVHAMMKAIADGMATLDETFPPVHDIHDPETGEVAETANAAAAKPAEKPSTLDAAAKVVDPNKKTEAAVAEQAKPATTETPAQPAPAGNLAATGAQEATSAGSAAISPAAPADGSLFPAGDTQKNEAAPAAEKPKAAAKKAAEKAVDIVAVATAAHNAFATLEVNQFAELRTSGKTLLDGASVQAEKDIIKAVYDIHAKRLAGEYSSLETLSKVRHYTGNEAKLVPPPATPGKDSPVEKA